MSIIEAIKLEDVLAKMKTRYNSNNHWENNVRPADYDKITYDTYTDKWIDNFRDCYVVINIPTKEIWWLKEAAVIGKHTKKFSHIYDENLDELCKFMDKNNFIKGIFDHGEKYFVRTDDVSLKYGCNGAGPYINFRQIVESLVSSSFAHAPISEKTPTDKPLKLYLMKWIENMPEDTEFRVFVNNNKITAISQQHLYQINKVLQSSDDKTTLIQKWIKIITDYFENTIKKKITHISSYCIDIVIINDMPYFIEINCFGKEYAAGSALFHWLIDEKILYGDGNVYFRYVE